MDIILNAAIIGLGNWGQVLVRSVHGKSDIVRFSHGVTRTLSRAEAFAEKAGIALSDDFEALLTNPDVDFVVLATPHSLHLEQIQAAAAAGKPVLCEKPLTLTAADARSAFAAADAGGVLLGVAQNRRFMPSARALETLIADGRLGELLHMEGNFSGPSGFRWEKDPNGWRARRDENPAGSMTARGLHVSDLMIHFAGLAESVFAITERRVLKIPVNDVTTLLLRFAGGPTASLTTMAATAETWQFRLYGSRGWAELRGPDRLVFRPAGGDDEDMQLPAGDTERAELEAFAAAVGGGAPYPVPAEQAVNNIAVLEGILASQESGGEISLDRF
ncbi:MAG TPA: Gfo/Idh/MocA family oxidoreductase [Afifellaceae bacterium]|nr:Gfo/Idh/MocA family oxidoreductase [Afifellaceae bacterium]